MEKPKEISIEDVSRELDDRVAGADTLRAEKLDQLTAVRKAKETAMQREQARLARKLGPEHPRVKAFGERLTVNQRLRRDLNLESARSRTELPQVDENTWAVFGLVRDADLKGVSGLTVALYDGNNSWIDSLGYTCTDVNGAFRIHTQTLSQVSAPVFVHVLNQRRTTLYVDQAPLTPEGGVADYREILLVPGKPVCTPPPATDQVRREDAPGAWIVRGRVTNPEGEGLADLTVSVYDKDLIFDDRLGETKTDRDGTYLFVYHVEDFRELVELKPDLYIKVLDQSRKTLYSSKKGVRYDAGKVEVIDIVIGAQKKK